MSKDEAIAHYESALKEAFPKGATGDVFHYWNKARKALAEQPAQQEQYTYTSTQSTMCAECGEHKHTPLRIDAMSGYVCLTCTDQKLGSLLGKFGYPKPEQPAQQEPIWFWTHPTYGRLYKQPPAQRTWVGLTEKEKRDARNSVSYSPLAMTMGEWTEAVQNATEAKLKAKNSP